MKVYYKRLVEGMTTAAIIHNSNYFLIDMPVYEDGTIDCWKRVQLAQVSEQLKKGWLVTSVPDGKSLSIHGLGNFGIKTSKWNYTNKSYEKHIYEIVKSMNSKMTGLFCETNEQKEKWEKYRVGWRTFGKSYKIDGNVGYRMTDGCGTKMFMNKNGAFHLVNITGFADNTYQIENGDIITSQEITDMVKQNILVCEPPLGVPVNIHDIGTIEISEVYWAAESPEKLKEILDFPNKAGDKETLHEICRNIYHEYLEYPNEDTRTRLRKAYEAVPEHERMYLGNMDSKDGDYRRILFHPERKREV